MSHISNTESLWTFYAVEHLCSAVEGENMEFRDKFCVFTSWVFIRVQPADTNVTEIGIE